MESTVSLRPGLPPHAKRVFKGVIFEVWQWQQQMFDGSSTTFECIWRPPSIEIICVVGEKILIGHQQQQNVGSFISLFGGRPETEDILVEAKRELQEETGYTSDDWQEYLHTHAKGHVIHDTYVFIARNSQKTTEQHLDAGEKITLTEISFEDFLRLPETPNTWIAPELISTLRTLRDDPDQRQYFYHLLFSR